MCKLSAFIYLLLSITLVCEVICDCGLPAIPVNTRIDNLKSRYGESESVKYVCEFNDHTIFGDDTRFCKNSSWTRSLPTCVSRYFVKWKIELDSNITQMSYKVSQDSKDKCIKIKNYNKDLSQIFHVRLENKTEQIIYLEIDFDNRDTDDFNISKVHTTDIRNCKLMRYDKHLDDTATHLFYCEINFDQIEEMRESWKLDSIDKITIVLNKNTVVVCDVRVYTELHSSRYYSEYYHWCGHVEKPLFSAFDVSTNKDRDSDETYWTFFRYSCAKGFKLLGKQVVRCGVTNQWLDPFPVCIPDTAVTCNLHNNDSIISAGVSVQYERLHAFNGTHFAINDSIAIFSCINKEHIMVGDSVQICDGNGKWIGFQPFCCDIKTISHHEIYEKTRRLFAENLKHIQNYKTDGENRCGIPSFSLHTGLTNYGSMSFVMRHQLLKSDYSNGSRYAYSCGSFAKWTYSNKSVIQCIDGVWRENRSVCYMSRGNKILLNSIDIYNYDLYKNQFYFDHKFVVKRNEKEKQDSWGSYWKNEEENECEPTVSAKSKQKWILRFNESSIITRVKLGLKNYRELNSTGKSLIKVFVNQKECPMLPFEIYYFPSHIEFNCENIINKTTDQITIEFNLSSPRLKPMSLCSVFLFYNEVKCGSPTKPLNSIVTIDSKTRNAMYSCESDYELRGNQIVKCGMNGRWDGDVPRCVPKALCTKHNELVIYENNVIVKYFNTYKTSNRDVSKHGTIAIFTCHTRNSTKFILIGSRIRMCLLSGEWSGSLPVCKDYDTSEAIQLIRVSTDDTGMRTTTAIVMSIVFIAIIAAAIAYIYHRRSYFANLRCIRSVFGNYFRFGQQ